MKFPLTENDVTFTIECLPEDIPIRGNAIASGDEAYDREVENRIIADLESGNDWAWCTVKVTAAYEGLEGTAYLGGCSYASEADFKALGGYYDGMQADALADLNEQLGRILNGLGVTING